MSPERSTARVIYTLDRERTYHVVTLVLVVLAALVTWLVGLLTPAAMVREVGSVAAGRVLQVFLLLIGVGPCLAWLWWMRRYVQRITWVPELRQVRIERCGYLGATSWLVKPADVAEATSHPGRADYPGVPSVNAPYRTIRLRGRPALILDDQGTVHDEEALKAILDGRTPEEF
jgi:hypothetical protein